MEGTTETAELEEVEGAFVVRDGQVEFVPISVGIAGERHFEVLSGMSEGDDVVTGPFDVIRSLTTGDRIETTGPAGRPADRESE